MEILHIYKQSEINNNIIREQIYYDVYIHGGESISLKGIKKIHGYLGFSNVKKIDLEDIEEISGDLWVSTYNSVPNVITLGSLKKVSGSVQLRNTPIITLENLEYIGEDLDLRDTNIKTLSSLKYIGGKVSLPVNMRNSKSINNIIIKGLIKYYKNSVKAADTLLIESEIKVPIINSRNDEKYVGSLYNATKEQKEFFSYFKKSFENGIIIDVHGYLEYPRFLLQSMLSNAEKNENIEEWIKNYKLLIKAYPNIDSDAPYFFRYDSQNYQLGWEVTKLKSILCYSDIGFYEEKLNKKLFNVDYLLQITGTSELSNFGKQNIDKIKPFIKKQLDKFEQKWNSRFLNVFVDPKFNKNKDYYFFQQFYLPDGAAEQRTLNPYIEDIPDNYNIPLQSFIEWAIRQQCRHFISVSECLYRKSIGMPLVGEFWRSETELYYSIKEHFCNTLVYQHASPVWLGLQHLDIYIPKFNVGIEYQGIQHYKPINFFGGEEGYLKTKERDERKKKKCEENGCKLIYVNEGYNLRAVIEEISKYVSKNDLEKATERSIRQSKIIKEKKIEFGCNDLINTANSSVDIVKNQIRYEGDYNKKDNVSQKENTFVSFIKTITNNIRKFIRW